MSWLESNTSDYKLGTLDKRYDLHEELGRGRMGVVYRATDRLRNRPVALKQLTQDPGFTIGTDLSLALAREFKILASLRHPHIIHVLDYGFDARHRPYLTMDLLDSPRTITEVSADRPLTEQLELLLQLLQALVYLHQRGIIHRDLKPQNVLVINRHVSVLDFGLCMMSTPSPYIAAKFLSGGAPHYMAPELFNRTGGSRSSKRSDLYAVGVVAYEVFAGHVPFDGPHLIQDILGTVPDMTPVTEKAGHEITHVVQRLLAKDPTDRYAEATEVIKALAEATQRDIPEETADIRESFLQAAHFVGRDDELAQLTMLLSQALKARGSAWLIGGESGVGKSRLLDELRTLALVEGAVVLRGHAIRAGSMPYQLWREVLRGLCLLADLDDGQASIVKTIVPDIDMLLGRPIPTSPSSDPQALHNLLRSTVVEILQCLEQPVVIILEDLQWAGSESREMLKQLNQIVAERPLLILGSYRDDEVPNLPLALPGMQTLKLHCLTDTGIAALSESMLGAVGRQDRFVKLLQRKTDGNAFFAVEMVRALAEDAGQLNRIGTRPLPEKILPGSIAQLIQSRLGRVPPAARPLLQAAAVAGRQLDLTILSVLEPHQDLDRWLAMCASVAILHVHETRWRFAHDQFRDGILSSLSEGESVMLHRRVAEAIEAVYPEAPEHIPALAHLWDKAGDKDKARHSSRLAGQQAVKNSANAEAITYFRRALELLETLPQSPERDRQELMLLVDLSAPLQHTEGYSSPELGRILLRAQVLCEQISDEWDRFPVLWYLVIFYGVVADHETAHRLAEQSLRLAERVNDPLLMALAHQLVGWNLFFRGELTLARSHVENVIGFRDPQQFRSLALLYGMDVEVGARLVACWTLWVLGYPEQSLEHCQAMLALAEQSNIHRYNLALAQAAIGLLYQFRREGQAIQALVETCIHLTTEQGFTLMQAFGVILHGLRQTAGEQITEGLPEAHRGLLAFQATGAGQHTPYFLSQLAAGYGKAGQLEVGFQLLDEALHLMEKNGERYAEAEIHRMQGVLRLLEGSSAQAEASFWTAIKVARQQGAKSWELRATINLCRLWQEQNRWAEAWALLTPLYAWFSEGFDTPDLVEAKTLLEALSGGLRNR